MLRSTGVKFVSNLNLIFNAQLDADPQVLLLGLRSHHIKGSHQRYCSVFSHLLLGKIYCFDGLIMFHLQLGVGTKFYLTYYQWTI